MKQALFFILILMEAVSLRLFLLSRIPPLIDPSLLSQRFLSVLLSIGSSSLIFFYVKKIFSSTKYAFLTMIFFVNLPWTIEQGRIVSQVNNFLFLFMVSLLLSKKFKNYLVKAIVWFLLCLGLIWQYPNIWIFRLNQFVFSPLNFFRNIFLLISPELLFFKNSTFWWGGVRESGVMLFAFIPLFVAGLYSFLVKVKFEIVFLSLVILVVSALSPFLPESREYFLITPFISIVLALGVDCLFVNKSLFSKVLFYLLFILLLYDLSQFLHYYYVHYPQQVTGNINQIHEPF